MKYCTWLNVFAAAEQSAVPRQPQRRIVDEKGAGAIA